MAYNPYAAMGFPAKTPEQLAQEYNSLLTNYQNVYRNMQPMAAVPSQTPNVNAVSNAGDYRLVNKYDEVINTPTRLDGTASLFFDFDNMVFWSKKFVNGQHTIQAYKFMPINNSPEQTDTVENKSDDSKSNELDILSTIVDRLDKLEQRIPMNTRTRKQSEEKVDDTK